MSHIVSGFLVTFNELQNPWSLLLTTGVLVVVLGVLAFCGCLLLDLPLPLSDPKPCAGRGVSNKRSACGLWRSSHLGRQDEHCAAAATAVGR